MWPERCTLQQSSLLSAFLADFTLTSASTFLRYQEIKPCNKCLKMVGESPVTLSFTYSLLLDSTIVGNAAIKKSNNKKEQDRQYPKVYLNFNNEALLFSSRTI